MGGEYKHGFRADLDIAPSIIAAQSDSEKLLSEKYMVIPAIGRWKMSRPYATGLSGTITRMRIMSFFMGGRGEDMLLFSLLGNIQAYGALALPELCVMQYEDEPAYFKAQDRERFKGTPETALARYIRSSPISYLVVYNPNSFVAWQKRCALLAPAE